MSLYSQEPIATQGEDTVRINLPATTKYLHLLGPCLSQMLMRVEGLRDVASVAFNLQLAIHEACTNIVRHAYGGQQGARIEITLSLEVAPTRMVVELRDTGEPFVLEEVPSPDLEAGQLHGYGLFLMRSLLDEVWYEPQVGNNRWRLVKCLD
jgi:serine/threonine-protein kinase RsbW